MSGKLPFAAGDRRNLFDPCEPGKRFPAAVREQSAHKLDSYA